MLFLAQGFVLFVLQGLLPMEAKSQEPPQQRQQPTRQPLAELSLEELARIEVTTASKEPEEVWRTSALFVR